MSYVDEDGTLCARTYATFRIIGEKVVPGVVTELMQLEPAKAFERGEVRDATRRRGPGYWSLRSEGVVESKRLGDHISYLLDAVEPRRDIVQQCITEFDAHADIFCFWEARSFHGGPVVPVDVMRRLAHVGVPLVLDFYGD